ncbi:uncharacterized protein LOC116430172 [Nomia melanderi]|uniref:uncharacterized protein LOC116430172 n=1 Tax=Nomia melanderi TaxID=2448451 RepID=UPI0013046C9E|nr:uncharacterized protein LOC116430172 [Nomia melanderi]
MIDSVNERIIAMRDTRKTHGILRISVIVLVFCVDLSFALPTEQPTKFSLNTGSIGTTTSDDSKTTSRFEQGRALASESQNQVATVLPTKADVLYESQRSIEVTTNPPVTNTRPNARETVRLESESDQALLERPLTKPFMGVFEAFFKPTPLVDGIKENEKYGNTGDKFIGIGRALVSGFEGFSNFLNAVVSFPKNAAKKTSRGITEALNHVGARLIGLE